MTKFEEKDLMQIYIETNEKVTEYVFSNEINIHDERNIKQIFEETAKEIITQKLQKADKEFENLTEQEKQEIINENFKGVEKAMMHVLKTNSNE